VTWRQCALWATPTEQRFHSQGHSRYWRTYRREAVEKGHHQGRGMGRRERSDYHSSAMWFSGGRTKCQISLKRQAKGKLGNLFSYLSLECPSGDTVRVDDSENIEI